MEEVLLEDIKINVIGNIHLLNLFTPLIKQGQAKKVIVLSTGHADLDMISQRNLDIAPLYTISKGAQNIAVSKFSALYAKDGILYLSLSPGAVDTGHLDLNHCKWRHIFLFSLIPFSP